MKSLLVIAAILVASGVVTTARADGAAPGEQLAQRGRRKRIAGIVLTSIGIAAGAAAIGTAIYFETACSTSDCWSGLGAWLISLPVGVVGAGLIATGVPLWVLGNRDLARARSPALSFTVAPLRGGGAASLSGSF